MKKIKIETKGFEKEAVLYDDLAPITVKTLLDALPIKGYVKRWGDEIYFDANLGVNVKENSKQVVQLGDIAYWISGRAICIFFGKTPISEADKIIAASEVNVIGKVLGSLDCFKDMEEGEEILLTTPVSALHCPECDSTNIEWVLPQTWSKYRCKDCGYVGAFIVEK